MKLSNYQIDYIDAYLEKRSLDYLDFKIEIKDHLACEIEALMQNEEATFEEAFKIIEKEWHYNLSDAKWSWLINNKRTFPKIIFRKIRNRFIKFYSFTILFALFVGFFPQYFDKLTKYISPFNDIIKYIMIFICFFTFLGFIKLNMLTKNKTSYSGMFNKISYSSITFFALTFIINNVFLFGVYYVLYSLPFLVYNYYNHQKFIKNYNLA